MRKYTINESESGLRLDKFICKKINANKAFLSMMIRKKQIKINGKHPNNYNLLINYNDEIIIYLDDSCFISEVNIKPNFSIIYEDENILIIDKEKGMVVHDVKHHDLVSLVNSYLTKKNEQNAAPVNRLDQNTSGLIIFSKSSEVTKELSILIENKEIKKEYIALVKGAMERDSDKLINYYNFDEKSLKAEIYKEKCGSLKEIITEYVVIKRKDGLSLLKINLSTGRTHQIRAHLAFIGHPIIGDNKYGDKLINKELNKTSQELISYRISFPSNMKGKLSYLSGKIFESNKRIIF